MGLVKFTTLSEPFRDNRKLFLRMTKRIGKRGKFMRIDFLSKRFSQESLSYLLLKKKLIRDHFQQKSRIGGILLGNPTDVSHYQRCLFFNLDQQARRDLIRAARRAYKRSTFSVIKISVQVL